MAIKIKYRDPKTTDFSKEDLVINTKTGDLFYKSEKGLHKLKENQTTPTPTPTTNYFYERFSADWEGIQSEKGIPWAGNVDVSYVRFQNVFVTPHEGTIHKLYWKQTGSSSNITVKVYIKPTFNETDTFPSITGALLDQTLSSVNVGTGNGGDYGDLNTLPINLNFNTGDIVLITLQANGPFNLGIHEISGQLLYSQNIII